MYTEIKRDNFPSIFESPISISIIGTTINFNLMLFEDLIKIHGYNNAWDKFSEIIEEELKKCNFQQSKINAILYEISLDVDKYISIHLPLLKMNY